MGCGICGFVGLSDRGLLQSMCEAIRHRGPDDSGYYLDNQVGLGVDRLKVIDLKTGDQPIHNEDETVWTVFNGEIYNYLALRNELSSLGHKFYTESDTESIVHAYEEWGSNCVKRLRGMFAFAIWDAKSRKLFLARDRFGKKPLYYTEVEGVFLFASEIKSILRFEQVKREIDYEALDHFFTYMYIPSPLTIFRNIRKLPPGHLAIYERGNLTVTQYWDMEFRLDSSIDLDQAVDVLYQRIRDAVRIRLKSDVPLGAFLSGGIDSSIVVSVMSELSAEPIKTVSIGFSSGTSEVKHSRLLAEALETDHKEYTVTPSALEILPRLVHHFDEPFADHSMIPTYYLSEVTRKEVTVALSGDGGDELFMGYPFLKDPLTFSVYSKIPTTVRRPVLKTISNLPISNGVRRMANHAYEKNYGAQSVLDRYVMRVTSMDPAGLRKLYSQDHQTAHPPSNTYDYLTKLMNRCTSEDLLNVIDYGTIRSYLEEDILTKVDRMSMAVSLEVRCPLLDQELASYVGTLPSWLKMSGRETKYILKRMAVKKELIPKEIVHRKKQGFGAPLEAWMKADWREQTAQMLDPIISGKELRIFDAGTVRRYLDDPSLHSNRIFSLMTFLIWYRLYISGEMKMPQTIALA